ncbi:MAG: amidohydrolase family protein [Acidimicrobiia bacterium]
MASAVDIHAHFFPEAYLKLIAEDGGRCGARLSRSDPKGPVIELGALRSGPLRAAFSDLDLRRREMDRQKVGVHALSLTLPMVYWADGELGLRLARAFNNALGEAHTAFPDRFVGLATLPMQEPRLALEELERARALPGIRGVYLGTNIWGRELSDLDFFPVYERMAALGLPLFLHPVTVVGAEHLESYYLKNLLGNPFDSAVAAAHLIFGGVLDRVTRLQVCLPHAGGAFPYLAGRLTRGWKVRSECQHLKRPPTAYLRRFTYDTISHSDEALRYLIRIVGADRVLLGSDYCFDMGYERPVDVITRLRFLKAADRARILRSNAARLLRLT